LDYIISAVRTFPQVSDIVLGISEGVENQIYQRIALERGLRFITGSQEDVLQRLIQCCEAAEGSDIFRLTTESPFNYFEFVEEAWTRHVNDNNDLTTLDNVPDGSGFEIISLEAYKRSWDKGQQRHRSELCSLYIRENKLDFKIGYLVAPVDIQRTDIRLTVDYPEDLIVCRAVYKHFKHLVPKIPIEQVIKFLDSNPQLKAIVAPYVEEGVKTMYV
jgi:spore coat polysaccharide biosynthesis protein SpsF